MSDSELQEPIATYMSWLRSKDPNERREAAYQLGERGVGDALPDLIRLYQKEKNRSVRKAVIYALGMFRAVEVTLATGSRDKDEVFDLLRDVDEGELGKRADKGALIRQIVALILTLIALIAAYILLPERVPTVGVGPIQIAAAVGENRAKLLSDLNQGYVFLRDDTGALTAQFQGLLGGQGLGCNAFFNVPEPYQLAPGSALAYPDIASIAADYNLGVTAFLESYQRYEDDCFNAIPLPMEQVGAALAALAPVREALGRLETALNAANAAAQPTPIPPTAIPPTAIPPTDPPAAAPTEAQPTPIPPTEVPPTDAPSGGALPTLEPTVDPSAEAPADREGALRHVSPLYAIIDNVTAPRGAATLLVQYWQDAETTGATDGCSEPRPNIPDNYIVLPEADLDVYSELAQAVQLVNVGLDAVRNGWVTFRGVCATGGLAQRAANEGGLARTALNSFFAAQARLNELMARVG
jgi:hypothetical protein